MAESATADGLGRLIAAYDRARDKRALARRIGPCGFLTLIAVMVTRAVAHDLLTEDDGGGAVFAELAWQDGEKTDA